MVVLIVVRTADSYTAFHLLDRFQMSVEAVTDSLAHSSEKERVAAGEMREGSVVCSSANASRAKQRLR